MSDLALDDADVRVILGAALGTGGEFAEIYAEHKITRALRLDDGRVEDVVSGVDRGAGIRIVRGRRTAYAYTNVLTRDALVEAAQAAAAGLPGDAGAHIADLTDQHPPFTHPPRQDPFAVDQHGLAEITRRAEQAARDVGPEVRQVTITYGDVRQSIFLANSDGHRSTEQRVRTRLVAQAVAARDDVIQTGFEGPGASQGHELFDAHPPEQIGRLAAERAVTMLDSRPAPSGEFTVVLAPGSGGVLFHEACGHGMEADIIAKGASVYADRRGQKIGTDILTGVDDATMPGGWGSFGVDDEGTPAQRTVLFEGGVCTDYMSDRLRAAELGIARSGNARRQGYASLPIPRMTNSYILSGPDDPHEILRSVKRGVWCESLGGGQVDPASGDFVFGIAVGHWVENGELAYPIRGANLVGDGPTVLARIDALGTDFGMRQGICGKDAQAVPVGLGNPTVRIDRITIGGTA